MSLRGSDVEGLRHLARTLLGSKVDVESVIAELDHELAGLSWVGPDRERFLTEWHQHSAQLRLVSAALDEAASHAAQHAEQQATVSGEN